MPTSLRWRYLAVADVRLSEVVQTFLLGCYLTYNTESVTETCGGGGVCCPSKDAWAPNVETWRLSPDEYLLNGMEWRWKWMGGDRREWKGTESVLVCQVPYHVG